jgi:hypothetical protein
MRCSAGPIDGLRNSLRLPGIIGMVHSFLVAGPVGADRWAAPFLCVSSLTSSSAAGPNHGLLRSACFLAFCVPSEQLGGRAGPWAAVPNNNRG